MGIKNPEARIEGFTSVILVLLLIVSCWLITTSTLAQSKTELILTWQAINFYPSDYTGKAEASPGSAVLVSTVATRDGQVLDLSQAEFTWYTDEKFFSRSVGQEEIMFNIKKTRGDSHFIRVAVGLGNESFGVAITVPVGSQKVSIDVPYAEQEIPQKSQAMLSAIPYFFNVGSFEELSFFWFVDGEEQAGQRKSQLNLSTGESSRLRGNEFLITSAVANNKNPLESARSNVRLTIK